MLFNSSVFLFGFLPIVLAGFFLIARANTLLAAAWLAVASFIFYGWWNPRFVLLLLVSVAVNFRIGSALAGRHAAGKGTGRLLAVGIMFNLALLSYFKYANFLASAVAGILGTHLGPYDITLPIGISFFTFTQIAFLVDASRGRAAEYKPAHYGLFVSYFPHLVAGPILHHREMMPQFDRPETYRPKWENFAVGLTILSIGLFKKVVIADSLAPHADAVFGAAGKGMAVPTMFAWLGALTYTFQLYFDFSGYSDMAIGISRLFGVKLPINFDSPYKATNIADFWRRWHMTLSRFLRDYLYIPLGGNRRGRARTYVSLMTTMLLGGLWHGAGWTFVAWGVLHGMYLSVHRAFVAAGFPESAARSTRAWRISAGALTFLCVVIAWVFFRADSFSAALAVLHGMAGLGEFGEVSKRQLLALALCGGAVWLLPNTQEFMAKFDPAIPVYREIRFSGHPLLSWTPALNWALVAVGLAWFALIRMFSGHESPFLYFNF